MARRVDDSLPFHDHAIDSWLEWHYCETTEAVYVKYQKNIYEIRHQPIIGEFFAVKIKGIPISAQALNKYAELPWWFMADRMMWLDRLHQCMMQTAGKK